ncbi:MAG: HAD family phosphatase [Actinomycetota bacterium]|nr:HAD family phosphatase [Actinomycetota bacterium]
MTPDPQAVLWDMDGLLVDSEPLWTVAETELARRLGGSFSEELKASIVGTRLDVAVPLILQWYGYDPEPGRVSASCAWLLSRMTELFAEPLPLLPGVAGLLADLGTAGVPMALVSSSYRVLVDAVLAHGVGPFDVAIGGDELPRGKPDPLPYTTAAFRLGVEPTGCVVLEDSPAGVASGLAAGCAVLAVPSVAGVVFPDHPRLAVRACLADVSRRDLAALLRPG